MTALSSGESGAIWVDDPVPFLLTDAGWKATEHRCGSCGRVVALLVDDSELCIRCDALFYPDAG